MDLRALACDDSNFINWEETSCVHIYEHVEDDEL